MSETPARDRHVENELLALTTPAFRDQVLARLDRAGQELGRDLPTDRTPAELVGEIREECQDIGGWAAMLLQVAALHLTPFQLERLRGDLVTVIVLASHADEVLAVVADDVAR